MTRKQLMPQPTACPTALYPTHDSLPPFACKRDVTARCLCNRVSWHVGFFLPSTQPQYWDQPSPPQKQRLPDAHGRCAPSIQISVPAIHPNALPPPYRAWGALFTMAKAQAIHARLEEVMARECNENIDLSCNHCLLSWALKEAPKSHGARLGLENPIRTHAPKRLEVGR